MTKEIYWEGVLEWYYPTKVWKTTLKDGHTTYKVECKNDNLHLITSNKELMDWHITKHFKE